MKVHSKVHTGVNDTWTIYYPSTEIELDTGAEPLMDHSGGNWSVHYTGGCIVCLSALDTQPTPYVPLEAMKAYLEVIEDWLLDQ